jgi:putative transcriptional regulator
MSKRGKRPIINAKAASEFAQNQANWKRFRADVPEVIDVKAIRTSFGMTQRRFALCFGFTTAQIRFWEQAVSAPTHASRAYLRVIAHNPKAVHKALASA